MIGNKLKNMFRVDPKADSFHSIEQAATLYPYSSIIQQAYLLHLKAINSNRLLNTIQQKALQINNRAVLKQQIQQQALNASNQRKTESTVFSVDDLEELPEIKRPETEKDKAIEAFLSKAQDLSTIQAKDSTKKEPQSLQSELDLVSETLAQIFVKQGNFDKAIEIYSKLTLKYPEKRDYFAALIKKLK